MSQVYADKKKVAGVGYGDSPPLERGARGGGTNDIELIYHRYLQAFKKGVFNYIKEDQDLMTQETIPRKYFSGGTNLNLDAALTAVSSIGNGLQRVGLQRVIVDFAMQNNPNIGNSAPLAWGDLAMSAQEREIDNYWIDQRGIGVEHVNFQEFLDPILGGREQNKAVEAIKAHRVIKLSNFAIQTDTSLPFGDFADILLKYFEDIFPMEWETPYAIKELLKNAFYHGNKMHNNVPIYLFVDTNRREIEVYDLGIQAETDQYRRLNPTKNEFGGFGKGLERIAKDGWILPRLSNVLDIYGQPIGNVQRVILRRNFAMNSLKIENSAPLAMKKPKSQAMAAGKREAGVASRAMISSEESQKKIAALEEIMKGEGGEENIREINISYDEGLKRFGDMRSPEDGKMVKINLNGLQNDYGKLRPGLTPILNSIALKLGLEESEKERIFTLLTQALLSNNQDYGLPIYIKINKLEKTVEVFDLNLIESSGLSRERREVVKSGEKVVGAKVKISFANEAGSTSRVMEVVDLEEFIKEIGDMRHENDEGHYKDDIGDIKWIDKSGKGFNVKIQRKTLETIILELIDNGIDHGTGDKVDITILRKDDKVEIRVTNKGYVDFDGLRLKLISLGINGQLSYENNHWVVLPEYQKNRNFVVREPDLPKGAELFYLVQGLSFQLDPNSKEGQRELQKKKRGGRGEALFSAFGDLEANKGKFDVISNRKAHKVIATMYLPATNSAIASAEGKDVSSPIAIQILGFAKTAMASAGVTDINLVNWTKDQLKKFRDRILKEIDQSIGGLSESQKSTFKARVRNLLEYDNVQGFGKLALYDLVIAIRRIYEIISGSYQNPDHSEWEVEHRGARGDEFAKGLVPFSELTEEVSYSYIEMSRHFKENASKESKKGLQILEYFGPTIKDIVQEELGAGADLEIAIVPLGSILKGYAREGSDIEYTVCILKGASKWGRVLDKDVESRIFKAINKLIWNKMPTEEYLERGLLHIYNYSNIDEKEAASSFENDVAFAFLPAIYGNSSLIDQVRKDILLHFDVDSGFSWQRVQVVFNNITAIDPAKVAGRADAKELVSYNSKRRLPSLEVMLNNAGEVQNENGSRAMVSLKKFFNKMLKMKYYEKRVEMIEGIPKEDIEIMFNKTSDGIDLNWIIAEIIHNAQGGVTIKVFKKGGLVGISVTSQGKIDYDALRRKALRYIKQNKLKKLNGRIFVVNKDTEVSDSDLANAKEVTPEEVPYGKDLLWIKGLPFNENRSDYRGATLFKVRQRLKNAGGGLEDESVGETTTFTAYVRAASFAMVTPEGGIDLTPGKMNLQTKIDSSPSAQNDRGMVAQAGIKFHLDPAMLAQLRNAPGFVPVIISIEPLEDLQGFLGVQNDSAPHTPATV